MKILHTADWHVGVETHGTIDPKTGLSTRLLDFLTSIDFVVDYAIKHNVDAFLFAGDAFKVRDPNPTHQREFSTRIRKLAKVGIPVFLCIGNHDTPMAHGRATSVDIYQALEMENVWISRRPEIVTIPTKGGRLQILSIPWLTSENMPTIGETLHDLYKVLDSNLPTVTVAHADVAGAVYSSEQQISITRTSHVFPLSLLTHQKIDYVALGHIHRHQTLANNPPVVYSGSIERIDFGEEEEEKGFVVVNIEAFAKKKRQVTWTFHQTQSRPFKTIRHTIDPTDTNPTATIGRHIKNSHIDGSLLRVILTIPANVSAPLDLTTIRKLCKNATLTGISRIIEQQARARLSGIESPTTSLSTMDALKAYLAAKDIKGERAKELVDAAEKLIL